MSSITIDLPPDLYIPADRHAEARDLMLNALREQWQTEEAEDDELPKLTEEERADLYQDLAKSFADTDHDVKGEEVFANLRMMQNRIRAES